MNTTVLPCPKCRLPVRLREGESEVQCEGCGATVKRLRAGEAVVVRSKAEVGALVRQGVLTVSLLAIAGGLVALASSRRRAAPPPVASGAPAVLYTAPPPSPDLAPTPAGQLAWEPNARAPVVALINADAVEDVFGFFRVWDGHSAWIPYAGAFDGATMKPLWRTEALDPQLLKQPGVVPLAVVVGSHMVVADTSPTLRAYDLASGEKEVTLRLSGAIMDVCRAPDGEKVAKIWVKVVGGGDSMIELATSKADLAPRPKWCPEQAYQTAIVPAPPRHPTPADLAAIAAKKAEVDACAHTFENGVLAQAACHAPLIAASAEVFNAGYALESGGVTATLGTKDGRAFVVASVASSQPRAPWTKNFVPDDEHAKDRVPAVADLAFGRLYTIVDRVYFDARLSAIDAQSGKTLWEAPIIGSLPGSEGTGRGLAHALTATASRVYVVRAGGGLDIFDASSGAPIGTIGRQGTP